MAATSKTGDEMPLERQLAKAQVLADVVSEVAPKDEFVRRDGKKVVIEQVACGMLDLKTNTVKPSKDKTDALWVRMSVDGKYENGDGWYGWVNPPVDVLGKKMTEIELSDGRKIKVPEPEYNPTAALREILGVR